MFLPMASLAAAAQIFGCGDDGVLPAVADGRQNPVGNPPGYVEWWFFTAFSKSSDVGAAFTYHPSHKSVDFMLYLNATTPEAKIMNFAQSFDNASSTTDNATISIDGGHGGRSCEIVVQDAKTYEVRGWARAQSGNGSISWSFVYVQAVDGAREHADALGLVELDWLSYMPSASVTGRMVYDDGQGRTLQIPMGEALGYHDHNSGRWPKKKVAARRHLAAADGAAAVAGGDAAVAGGDAAAATSTTADLWQPERPELKLAFDYKWGSTGDGKAIGAVYGAYLVPDPLQPLKPFLSVGYIFVRAHGRRVKFGSLCRHHKLTVRPTGFVDRPEGHREATGVHLTAETPEWSLDWRHAVLSSGRNPGGGGLGLLVYEQLSHHNLTLTPKTHAAASFLLRGEARAGAVSGEPPAASPARAAPAFATLRGAYGFTEWSNPL